MLPIQTLLHPTDFSDRSQNALVLASSLARDYGAHLILLHVLPRPIIGFGEGVIPPDISDLRAEARNDLRLAGDPEAVDPYRRWHAGSFRLRDES